MAILSPSDFTLNQRDRSHLLHYRRKEDKFFNSCSGKYYIMGRFSGCGMEVVTMIDRKGFEGGSEPREETLSRLDGVWREATTIGLASDIIEQLIALKTFLRGLGLPAHGRSETAEDLADRVWTSRRNGSCEGARYQIPTGHSDAWPRDPLRVLRCRGYQQIY